MIADDDTAWLDDEQAHKRRVKLVLDQTELALRNIAPNHWIVPVFALIVCTMFRQWVPPALLLGWLAGVAVGVVPLAITAAMFAKRKSEIRDENGWLIAIAAAYSCTTITWASLGYFLWVPGNDLNHMVVILLIAITLSGSTAMLSASTPLSWVSFTVYGSALVLVPLQEGGMIYGGLTLLAILFVIYLAYMSRQMYATARDMLLLRDDKNELITALANAKWESDQARARAEAASLAKSQFLANMSHELRTPLNAILGFSEIISTTALTGDKLKHREYADLIHYSGQHLLTLINDILDLAKIESGRFVLRDVEVSLEHLIDDAHTLMEPKATAGHCVLAKAIDADLPHVSADERAIRQVLLNLLSNAVKFTPPGGCVTSFARMEIDGRIAFGVTDTGVGIAKEDHARVFEKFGQGRHDVVSADKGTGLGLPIVKGLVEAHGGTVTLESTVGAGTTVTVRFPATRLYASDLRAAS